MPDHPHIETARQRLLAKLASLAPLTDEDRQGLLSLPLTFDSWSAGQDIVCQGEAPNVCAIVVEGFVCRFKLSSDGAREILAWHLPGDTPDFQSLYLKRLDHGLGAVSDAVVAFVQHKHIGPLLERSSAIRTAFFKDVLQEAAVYREWLVNIGHRPALQRMAHMFCEIATRFDHAGFEGSPRYPLPLLQADLADALGLSGVHVNRVLQELRRMALVAVRGRTLEVLDRPGLEELGGFDPDYLRLV